MKVLFCDLDSIDQLSVRSRHDVGVDTALTPKDSSLSVDQLSIKFSHEFALPELSSSKQTKSSGWNINSRGLDQDWG
jgi:hypothetical protein